MVRIDETHISGSVMCRWIVFWLDTSPSPAQSTKKFYYKSGRPLLQKWWVITKVGDPYDKSGNPVLLQKWAILLQKWWVITKVGNFYYKSGDLLQKFALLQKWLLQPVFFVQHYSVTPGNLIFTKKSNFKLLVFKIS